MKTKSVLRILAGSLLLSTAHAADESVVDHRETHTRLIAREERLTAAAAANAAYNLVKNDEGITLPEDARTYGFTGKQYRLADDKSNIQAFSAERDGKLYISFRGTARNQDWKANLGIGYACAASYAPEEREGRICPVKQIFDNMREPITYHGIKENDPYEFFKQHVIGGIFTLAAPTLGVSAGAVLSLQDMVSLFRQSAAWGSITAAAGFAAGMTFAGLTGGIGPAAIGMTGTVSLLSGFGTGVVRMGIGGFSQMSSRFYNKTHEFDAGEELIFNSSKFFKHTYGKYVQESYDFARAAVNSALADESYGEGIEEVVVVGHSLGAHLATVVGGMLAESGLDRVTINASTFARPNGVLGAGIALENMGYSREANLLNHITQFVPRTVSVHSMFDVVPKIGSELDIEGRLGNLQTLTEELTAHERLGEHYKRGSGNTGITAHHSMSHMLQYYQEGV